MIRIAAFYIVLTAAWVYALRRGGAPEKAAGTMMVVAAVATSLLPVLPGVTFVVVEWPRIVVDLLLFGGLLLVAVYADRFWPIYAAAFHALTITAHGVRAFDPHVLPIVYTRVAAWLSYPVLILLVVGVRHQAALRDSGVSSFDWTAQRHEDRRNKAR